MRPQTISFTSTPPSPALVAGPTYTVTATATSGLPVTFTDGSGSTLTFLGGELVLTTNGTYTLEVEAQFNGGGVTMTPSNPSSEATAALAMTSFAVMFIKPPRSGPHPAQDMRKAPRARRGAAESVAYGPCRCRDRP